MKQITSLMFTAVAVAAALSVGYWLGRSKHFDFDFGIATEVPQQPMPSTESVTQLKRKILYYRNPMGLSDISPVPKKDPMGMDYIPVYEGEEPEGPVVRISLDKVQKLGVRTEASALRGLERAVRAVGTLESNERLRYEVTTKFEGWIQKLYVNATGETVRPGQPLMDVYSPDLITAQEEYLIARKGVQALKEANAEVQASMQRLMESALQRLRNWDVSEQELRRLEKEGKVSQYLTLRAPVNGVVLEKPAVEGMRFMPGELLYRIADLSSLWLLVDVFEQDLALVHAGQKANIRIDAYPDKAFTGKVVFVYPSVTPETRTAKVRIELPNSEGLLRLAMYARVEIVSEYGKTQALTVPDSAVLDSGVRQLLLVQRGEGLFEPREVKLGMRADGYVEILEGLRAGEGVVVSANFLIDAESNLKAALSSFASHGTHSAVPPGGATVPAPAGGTSSSDSSDTVPAHGAH